MADFRIETRNVSLTQELYSLLNELTVKVDSIHSNLLYGDEKKVTELEAKKTAEMEAKKTAEMEAKKTAEMEQNTTVPEEETPEAEEKKARRKARKEKTKKKLDEAKVVIRKQIETYGLVTVLAQLMVQNEHPQESRNKAQQPAQEQPAQEQPAQESAQQAYLLLKQS